jgi:hypothetical protein
VVLFNINVTREGGFVCTQLQQSYVFLFSNQNDASSFFNQIF